MHLRGPPPSTTSSTPKNTSREPPQRRHRPRLHLRPPELRRVDPPPPCSPNLADLPCHIEVSSLLFPPVPLLFVCRRPPPRAAVAVAGARSRVRARSCPALLWTCPRVPCPTAPRPPCCRPAPHSPRHTAPCRSTLLLLPLRHAHSPHRELPPMASPPTAASPTQALLRPGHRALPPCRRDHPRMLPAPPRPLLPTAPAPAGRARRSRPPSRLPGPRPCRAGAPTARTATASPPHMLATWVRPARSPFTRTPVNHRPLAQMGHRQVGPSLMLKEKDLTEI